MFPQYEAEKVETGGVSTAVYLYYIVNMGLMLFGLSFIFHVISTTFNSLSSVWLSRWSDASLNNETYQVVTSVFLSDLVNNVFTLYKSIAFYFNEIRLYIIIPNNMLMYFYQFFK